MLKRVLRACLPVTRQHVLHGAGAAVKPAAAGHGQAPGGPTARHQGALSRALQDGHAFAEALVDGHGRIATVIGL